MAEQYMSLAESESPEDLTAYQGLEPGWYTDPADPTVARFWDGTALGHERHPVDTDSDVADDVSQHQQQDLQPDVVEPVADVVAEELEVPVVLTAVQDVDDADVTANAHDDSENDDASASASTSAYDGAPEDAPGVCVKCEQPGRYYNNPDWSEEIRDNAGELVLMGSKYSDDMTCLECETELDSHHTERWIEVWAQKPRALATRKKSLSQPLQSSGTGN